MTQCCGLLSRKKLIRVGESKIAMARPTAKTSAEKHSALVLECQATDSHNGVTTQKHIRAQDDRRFTPMSEDLIKSVERTRVHQSLIAITGTDRWRTQREQQKKDTSQSHSPRVTPPVLQR